MNLRESNVGGPAVRTADARSEWLPPLEPLMHRGLQTSRFSCMGRFCLSLFWRGACDDRGQMFPKQISRTCQMHFLDSMGGQINLIEAPTC